MPSSEISSLSNDLNQAVTLTFDPDLQIGGCHCWQLLRRHDHHNSSSSSSSSTIKTSYSIQESENLISNDGVALIAMSPDGGYFVPSSSSSSSKEKVPKFYFAAPSTLHNPELLTKPVKKDSITLLPYFGDENENDDDKKLSALFAWKVSRFPGGGIAFSTTMFKVKEFVTMMTAANDDEKKDKIEDSKVYYLTDDARLLSDEHTGGDPVGFGMNLAYPPVVDVTSFLSCSSSSSIAEQNKQIEKTKRFLIDAAIDCGFFFSAIRYCCPNNDDDENSNNENPFLLVSADEEEGHQESKITTSQVHEASTRLMKMIRVLFGRSVSAKKNNNNNNNNQNIVPLDEKLTKVTLKSTTGEVKTSFNPPISVKIDLPMWMKEEEEEDSCSKSIEQMLKQHFAQSHRDQNKETESKNGNHSTSTLNDDLRTQFRFGEELASLMVGVLLEGVIPQDSTTLTSNSTAKSLSSSSSVHYTWPTEEMIKQNPRLYKDIEKTVIISSSQQNNDNNDKIIIPRAAPNQFYSLFRSVCYPPSTRRHDKKLREKMMTPKVKDANGTTTQSTNEAQGAEQDEEEVEYVYEEVEEEVEEEETQVLEQEMENRRDKNEDDEKSSHKSSDTDNSQGKGLYEHTDKTWITILTASPSLHGLEVVDCDGSTFTECCVPKFLMTSKKSTDEKDKEQNQSNNNNKVFSFVCNIGDALQMVSNGKYISRTHRARNPNSNNNSCVETKKTSDDDIVTQDEEDYCCCQKCRVSLPLFVEPTPYRWPVPYLVEKTEHRVL